MQFAKWWINTDLNRWAGGDEGEGGSWPRKDTCRIYFIWSTVLDEECFNWLIIRVDSLRGGLNLDNEEPWTCRLS